MINEIRQEIAEEEEIDELVEQLIHMRDLAYECEEVSGDYAGQDMDDRVNEEIASLLHEMDNDTLLKILKKQLGVYTLRELVTSFKEICKEYGIKENEDEDA